jgi:serine/threonine-protein kinase
MGTVYRAYHPSTARIVALKQMKDLKDPIMVKRFDREVRLMRDLSHPNIVRCLDTGVDARGVPYLVTEYVDGGDLESCMHVAGSPDRLMPLSMKLAVTLTRRILDGVEYLHSRQIIHRDIKPQNILLRSAGRATTAQPVDPKIADFGLAVSYARSGGTRYTKFATGLGTLFYASPEQIRDASSVRETADVYAVGMVLYYLLTARYAYEFPTPAQVLALQNQKPDLLRRPHEALRILMHLRQLAHPFQIILEQEPIPIRKREPSIPAGLAQIVDRAIRKDPSARFQTAAALRHALERT